MRYLCILVQLYANVCKYKHFIVDLGCGRNMPSLRTQLSLQNPTGCCCNTLSHCGCLHGLLQTTKPAKRWPEQPAQLQHQLARCKERTFSKALTCLLEMQVKLVSSQLRELGPGQRREAARRLASTMKPQWNRGDEENFYWNPEYKWWHHCLLLGESYAPVDMLGFLSRT